MEGVCTRMGVKILCVCMSGCICVFMCVSGHVHVHGYVCACACVRETVLQNLVFVFVHSISRVYLIE